MTATLLNTVTDYEPSADFGRGWAVFDPSRRYRYVLGREWDVSLPSLGWLLLNPSTADSRRLDPTLRRCAGLSLRLGYGSMVVTNLFAIRSTDPSVLASHPDPVGAGNDALILLNAGITHRLVVGWGVHGVRHGRAEKVTGMLRRSMLTMHCVGVTKGGHPRHPLYVSNKVELQPWP